MPSVVFSFGVSVERGLNKAARRRRTREVLSSGQKRSRQTRIVSATVAAASGCLDILAGDWKFLTDDLQIVPADLKQYLRYQISWSAKKPKSLFGETPLLKMFLLMY